MAGREHTENYRITATDETQRALASVRRGFESVEGAISSVSRASAGLAAVAAAAVSVGHFVKVAGESEQASNRLAAVLRATGFAAGFTKQQLDAMADSMAQSTMFDDESIRDAQSSLLKFGNIQGQVFERGMKLAADYASFTGSEISDAAQVIGKALQSPEEGVGALERQIGKLTYTQKENIKTFMEQGRVLDAQGIVLDVLQKKIGGTSDYMNTGLTKSLKDVGKSWGELSETIGRSLPAQTGLKAINNALVNIKETIESGDWVDTLRYILFPATVFLENGGIKRTPKSKQVTGIIGGGPADPRLTGRLAEIDAQIEAARKKQAGKKTAQPKQEMSLDELLAKGAQKRLEVFEQAEQDAERAAADLRKEQERLRASVIDLIDPTAQYAALIQQYRTAMEEGIITAEQYTEAAFLLNEKMDEVIGNKLPEKMDKVNDNARELGLIFSSAASQAIRDWEGVGNLIRSIGQDVAQMMLKKSVVDPLANAASSLLGDVLGKLFSFEGGGYTGPGARSGGVDGRGGFMAVLHPNETVIDHTRSQGRETKSSGAVVINQVINFSANTPAAVRDAVYAATPGIVQASVAAVRDDRNRNGDRR